MPARINLHNHSSRSDGTLGPAELAAAAVRAGIGFFSLTDHDTTGGWPEIEPALKAANIAYCYGIELSTSLHDSLHVLGYGLNPADPGLAAKTAGFRARRLERLKKIIGSLRAMDIDISFEEIPSEIASSKGRPHIADLLKKKGYVKARRQAFEKYIGWGRPAYSPPAGPDMAEAIKTIKDAGGLAVLAHPGVVYKMLDLAGWKEMGLDGIEAFYPTHSRSLTDELNALAARYGLFVTAGTDFHGPGTDRDKMTGFDYDAERFKEIRTVFR